MAIYRETLIDALKALATGPAVPGSIARDAIQAGLRSLHVARHGRTGRHFILYRATTDDTIEVVRILHDTMDLARHVPAK